jgi:hypothetical protein
VIAVLVSFLGLFAVVTFALRAVLMPGVYGVVPVEMPVVAVPPADPGFHRFKEEPRDELRRTSPAVVLTTEAFYFGDLQAFTTNFNDPRDKYMIRHVDGEPQLQGLVETMNDWVTKRAAAQNVPIDKVLVFIPAGDIPMPIVIQVIAGLKKSPYFERVVIGSGLM